VISAGAWAVQFVLEEHSIVFATELSKIDGSGCRRHEPEAVPGAQIGVDGDLYASG